MNGWTNWHTWNAHLFLTNSSYRIYKTLGLCGDPDEIEKLFSREFGDGYDGIEIEQVNWGEIFKSTHEDSP